MSDDKYQLAFRKAQRAHANPITEADLMIIDQAYGICEKINQIEGFKASIDSIHDFGGRFSFCYNVYYNNTRQDFSLMADTGGQYDNKPKFSLQDGLFGDAKEISLSNDADIQNVLMTIVHILGKKASENERSQSLEDALARRRLMNSMPEMKF